MKVLLIGHTGTIGAAVKRLLKERDHAVITASRSSGDSTVDITDHKSVQAMYESVGTVDAVVVTSGKTPFAPLPELTVDDVSNGFSGKTLGAIDVILTGQKYITRGGSFTVTSGVLNRAPIANAAAAAAANGALDAFVVSAAAEVTNDVRINSVSPTVVTESLETYGSVFPGFKSVAVDDVALAYVRSIEGIESGVVYCVE